MAISAIEKAPFLEFVENCTPKSTKSSSSSSKKTSSSSSSGSSASSSSSSTKTETDKLYDEIKSNINITSDQRTMWSFIGNVVSGKTGSKVSEDVRLLMVQDALQRLQQLNTFISNMLKTLHDTAMGVISNLK